MGLSDTAYAASCEIGGSIPTGWTLNGVGGGVNATLAPLIPPGGSGTVCYIVTDTGGGWPGSVSTAFEMTGVTGAPNIPVNPDTGFGTTNGSQMISPVFTATAGQRLIFDFIFATNDGTAGTPIGPTWFWRRRMGARS